MKNKKKRIGIINVNLEYEIPDDVLEGQENKYLANVELPSEYVMDSFEIVKILKSNLT